MIKSEHHFIPFYAFQSFSPCQGIKHFVSSGAGSIGFTDEIAPEIIRQNRQNLAKAVGFDLNGLVTGQQVHSAHVAIVTPSEAGKGAMNKESRLPETDALITNQTGICLMVLSADCVPILLYDPKSRVIAAIHAGWKGTVSQIAAETVKVMQKQFGSLPENILAGIGPSIGKCCFEVGEDVASVFQKEFPQNRMIVFPGRCDGKYQVDLWESNRQELIATGLSPDHIETAGMCTVCHADHFFSYRREGKRAGRFGAGIMLCDAQQVKNEK